MTGIMVATAPCYVHGGFFEFHPDFVVSVLVDPETGMPPDLVKDPGSGILTRISPSPEAVDRSIARPVCADCCKRINRDKGMQLDERDSLDRALEEMR
jgi:hypothetical protein